MDLLTAWVLFPIVAGTVCLGLGLAVDRVSARAVPGALLVPVGLAAIVVGSQLLVWVRPLAPSSPWVLAGLALLGLAVGAPRLRAAHPDPWATAAAAAVFGIFAAPVALAPGPGFAGYPTLGDTAIHLELIDQLMTHGGSVAGLPPSSYASSLASYLTTSYPTGAHTALGALRPVTGIDAAWVYQPFLALMAAMTSLAFWSLATVSVPQRPLRALVVFIAAQPAIVYSYALEGSIKEVATIWLLASLAALAPVVVAKAPALRPALPFAVCAAAVLVVVDVAVAPWLGPLMLVLAVAVLWRRAGLTTIAISGAGFIALLSAMAAPTLAGLPSFLRTAAPVLTAGGQYGNLIRPLPVTQALGIWPRGDFRLPLMADDWWAIVLIGAAAMCLKPASAGLLRRRLWPPLLLLVACLVGWLYAMRAGSPWAEAKALMILAPPVVFASLLGAIGLREVGLRAEGLVLVVALGAGVVVSNALAYHDADLAPRDRLEELAHIDARFAGEGPTVYTEFEEFAKRFLRDLAPTGTTRRSSRSLMKRCRGTTCVSASLSDVDDFTLPSVERFRTIVLRRGPLASRPPSDYERVYRGRFYEVWQREGEPGRVLDHLPLGDRMHRGAVARCRTVRQLAIQARRGHAALASVAAPPLPTMNPTLAPPPNWVAATDDPGVMTPVGPGRSEMGVNVPHAGRWRRRLARGLVRSRRSGPDRSSDGRCRQERAEPAKDVVRRCTHNAAHRPLARDDPAGRRNVGARQRGSRIGGWDQSDFKPAALEARTVQRTDPASWRALCGKPLDWIEIVRR